MANLAPTKWYGFYLSTMAHWEGKKRQVVSDALHDYGKVEWKRTLEDLKKAPDVTYQDVFNEFNSTWGVDSFIVTRSSFGRLDHIWTLFLDLHLQLHWFACVWSYFLTLAIEFSIYTNNKIKWTSKVACTWQCSFFFLFLFGMEPTIEDIGVSTRHGLHKPPTNSF